ncbi:MAG: winged helix-turn-helix domain-containing protein, partial [Acidobacteriota bacterium]|nr:winged helix-turn-helix domain-containing protein [Acidobacteriota bacterium]
MERGKIEFYDFGGYRLDLKGCRLLRGETEIKATKKTLEVLRFFVENQGELLRKDYLIESLWNGVNVEEKTLMQYVYILRKTLGNDSEGDMFIKTVSKEGYCFVAEVEEVYPENQMIDQTVPASMNGAVSTGESSEAVYRMIKGFGNANRMKVFVVLLVSLISIVSLGYFLSTNEIAEPKKIESIAVLPLTQIGNEKDEKLGLGIADILISKLGESDNLVVTPTGSIIRYSSSERRNLFELGKSLDVDVVVDGTVQTEGDMVRTIVRLYSVDEKRQIWTGKFDKRYSDLFSLQDEISEQIAKELSLTLNTGSRKPEVA